MLLAERSLAFPCRPFPHQLEGIAFLYPRQAAILADEMGLGKTMQAITAIRLLVRSGESQRVLLVCPKPLVTNWRREFDALGAGDPGGGRRRRPRPAAVAVAACRRAGQNRQLRAGLPRPASCSTAAGGSATPLRPRGARRSAADQEPRQRAPTSRLPAWPGARSWALTGTPVENSPQDLVGIFEFLAPGLLSDEMKPRRMGRAVSDHVLRRTKDQVLSDLPPKLFRDAELELSPEQAAKPTGWPKRRAWCG